MADNSQDRINQFLNGRDPMERIVSIECEYNDEKVSIVFINANGQKRIKLDDFKPFVWAKNSVAVRMFEGDRNALKRAMMEFGIGVKALHIKTDNSVESDRLENGYKYIFYAKRAMSFQRFLQFFQLAKTPIYETTKKTVTTGFRTREFLAVSPVEQYMIYSGRRFFKGYESYDELKRFLFDLETQGLDPYMCGIDQIGIRTNKGFERIISVEGEGEDRRRSELSAIIEFLQILATEKPDIIAGHNSENFDWNFIDVRCKILGTTLEDLSLNFFKHPIYKRKKEVVLKLGGEIEYYRPTIIWGHTVVDSLHAVRRAQAIDSSMKLATLKYVTRYLNLKKENRVYVPGDLIGTIWRETDKTYAFNNTNGDWYKISDTKPIKDGYELESGRYVVERYLLDDIWETDKVELKLNESNFLIAKMLPTTFQRACTMGTAGIWKLIMLAWCFEHDLAVPAYAASKTFTGGLSRLLRTGYCDNVVKLDYNSLYPSIILTWNVKTDLDITNSMLQMLEYVLTQREKYKDLKKQAGKKAKALKSQLEVFNGGEEDKHKLKIEMQNWEAEASANDKKQLPLKILANSFFGSFGAPNIFPFGDTEAAEATTCIGRMSLRLMISHFTNLGYTPIVGDSVTYDTPVYVKYSDNRIDIRPICEIFNDGAAVEFSNKQYRDFSEKPYQILTRNGWQNISYVYKHKTDKELRRIETKNGIIDCTVDHSLFDANKNEIKPSNMKRGDSLEIYTNNIDYSEFANTSQNKAWLYGFFLGNGSSVYCDKTPTYFSKKQNKYINHAGKHVNWKISNQSLERLNKAKEILINEFGVKCDIKNHVKLSNGYSIVVEDSEFAQLFSNIFYTSYGYKKVPCEILNANAEIKKAFINGLCCGDGQGDIIDECIEFGQKSKVAMGGLFFILKELGINFRCHNRSGEQEFLSFRFRNHRGNLLNEDYSKRKENEVWNNTIVNSKSDFVYDISADGTFINALGNICCHNTDGFNFRMPDSDKFRYTKQNPYVSNGKGRNSVKDKEYIGVEADVCEFEDLYFNQAWNGGVNKMGLGIDEFCPATINFSRKNYADLLENGETKKVGNTIKSRRMSGYIEKFLDSGIDLLLNSNGQQFLENYYDYIEKIFNYQIPLRDIASKGKIKKTIEQYKADCNTLTKGGTKKSRQAWYELVIRADKKVELNDTIYYINTGTKKSESDVKRITHKFIRRNGELVELDSKVKKELVQKEFGSDVKISSLTEKNIKDVLKKYIVKEEDEIILNCELVSSDIINSKDDVMCSDEIEYNVVKYIDQFNKRITPLLVCFSPAIRDKILINNPSERQYFTSEECKLVSGMPNKITDQDTYEQLMTPERKEIEYWLSMGKEPPFCKECGIDWEAKVAEYLEIKAKEEDIVFQEENDKYLAALNKLSASDIEAFEEEGTIPSAISNLVTLDADMRFKFIKLPEMSPSTGGYIFDDISFHRLEDESEEDE